MATPDAPTDAEKRPEAIQGPEAPPLGEGEGPLPVHREEDEGEVAHDRPQPLLAEAEGLLGQIMM